MKMYLFVWNEEKKNVNIDKGRRRAAEREKRKIGFLNELISLIGRKREKRGERETERKRRTLQKPKKSFSKKQSSNNIKILPFHLYKSPGPIGYRQRETDRIPCFLSLSHCRHSMHFFFIFLLFPLHMVDVSLKINTFSVPVCVSINFLSFFVFFSFLLLHRLEPNSNKEEQEEEDELSFVSHFFKMNVNKECLFSLFYPRFPFCFCSSILDHLRLACLFARSPLTHNKRWAWRQDVTL